MTNIGYKKISEIYQGDNLIVDKNESTNEMKIGEEAISFVFQGNETLYPNPISTDLFLWYDFKGLKNNSKNKYLAKDLSIFGNNGNLKEFVYNDSSGYNNGLIFDGIDDYLMTNLSVNNKQLTISINIETTKSNSNFYIFSGESSYIFIRKNNNNLEFSFLNSLSKQELFVSQKFFIENYGSQYITFCMNVFDKTVKFYTNGDLLENFTMLESDNLRFKIEKIGRSNLNSGYFLKGKIKSFKVYKRALSQEEIQYNYKLEKERWNL